MVDAYFNNHDADPQPQNGSRGWVNIAGKLDAPFFEDLRVHIHTSADKDSPEAPIHLMGGWSANLGFEVDGRNDFTDALADPDNLGFPKGTASPGVYRHIEPIPANAGAGEQGKDLVRANRTWLGGIVDFDYPLLWELDHARVQVARA